MKKLALIAALFLLGAGCQRDKNESETTTSTYEKSRTPATPGDTSTTMTSDERSLHSKDRDAAGTPGEQSQSGSAISASSQLNSTNELTIGQPANSSSSSSQTTVTESTSGGSSLHKADSGTASMNNLVTESKDLSSSKSDFSSAKSNDTNQISASSSASSNSDTNAIGAAAAPGASASGEIGVSGPAGQVRGSSVVSNTEQENIKEEKNSAQGSPGAASQSGASSGQSDEMSERVWTALTQPATSSATPISIVRIVSSNDGIKLQGIVPSEKEKQEIENRVRQVEGVKNVKNELQISRGSSKESLQDSSKPNPDTTTQPSKE